MRLTRPKNPFPKELSWPLSNHLPGHIGPSASFMYCEGQIWSAHRAGQAGNTHHSKTLGSQLPKGAVTNNQSNNGGRKGRWTGEVRVRSIKTLGIATAMALTLTAFAAAGTASATTFASPGAGQGEVRTWSGALTGLNHVLKLSTESIGCTTATFSGETTGPEPHELTVTPQLSGCKLAGWTANFASNGCKYRFRASTVDIVGCNSPMSFTANSCTILIGNQSLGTMEYFNTESNGIPAVKMVASLHGIEFTRYNGGFCAGSSGTYKTGEYNGEWLVKGFNSKAEQKAIRIEASATPYTFLTEEAPVTAGGEAASPKASIDTGLNGTVRCKSRSFAGTAGSGVSVSFNTITVAPTYSECTWAGSIGDGTSVSMGGCSFEFQLNGEFAIVGESCASKPITITAGTGLPGCVGTIGPQVLSGLNYTMDGVGKLRGLVTGGEAKGLTITTTGAGCVVPGTTNTGVYKGIDRLTAFNSSSQRQGLWIGQ